MSHIFISYSRKDLDFAQKIVDALAANNLETWIDWKNIPPAEEWLQEIYNGIEAAEALLFLVSPDSLASRVCNQELEHAVENGKRIIPIIIRDPDSEGVPESLSKLNWIFYRDGQDDLEKADEKICETIRTDYEWLNYHTRLQVKALEWDGKKIDDLLLRGKELEQAEKIFSAIDTSKEPFPTELQRKYLLASRKYADQQRNKLVSGVSISSLFLACCCIAAIIASFIAWQQRNRANLETKANATAQAEVVVGETAQAITESEKERQRIIAYINGLTTQAENVSINSPQLSLLLLIEAVKIAQNNEASRISVAEIALRDGVKNIGGLAIQGHRDSVTVVALSNDSKWLATGANDSIIRLWMLEENQVVGEPIELKEHTNGVANIKFSPDGRWLVSGGFDNDVILWDLDSVNIDNSYIYLWEEECDGLSNYFSEGGNAICPIEFIEFSDNGDWLAISEFGEFDQLLLFDFTSDHPISPIPLHSAVTTQENPGSDFEPMRFYDNLTALQFSPDNKWLVAGFYSGGVIFWGLESESLLRREIYDDSMPVSRFAFSPDSKTMYSSNTGGEVQIWENLNSVPQKGNIVISQSLFDLIVSKDKQFLFGINNENLVTINLENPLFEIKTYKQHLKEITEILYLPDQQQIITAGSDQIIQIWNILDLQKDPIRLFGHDSPITNIALSSDGGLLVSGDKNGTVRLWDLDNSHSNISHNSIVTSDESLFYTLDISDDDSLMIAGTTNGKLFIWDVATKLPKLLHEFTIGGGLIRDVAVTPNKKWVVAAPMGSTSTGSSVKIWNINDKQPSDTVIGQLAPDSPYELSNDGHYLAVAGWNNEIRIYDLEIGDLEHPVKVLTGSEQTVQVMGISQNNEWLVGISQDQNIYLWNLQGSGTNTYIRSLMYPTHFALYGNVMFSPDDKFLVVNTDYKTFVWDAKQIETASILYKFEGHTGLPNFLQISPDNRWVISGSGALSSSFIPPDNTLLLWDLDSHSISSPTLRLEDPTDYILDIKISPDGKWLACSSADNNIYLWDLSASEISKSKLILSDHNDWVGSVEFTSDSRYLISASGDGTIRKWSLGTDDLVEFACQLTGRNFISIEWQQYFPGEEYRITCPQWPAGE